MSKPKKTPAKKAAPAKKPAAPAKKPAAAAKKPVAAAKKPARGKKGPAEAEQGLLDLDHAEGMPELEREPLEAAPAGDTRESVEDQPEDAGEDAEVVAEAPAVELSDEEKELQAVYGEDTKAPAIAHGGVPRSSDA